MKTNTRNRVAAVAVVSAMGIGALTYGLRAIPVVRQAVARLRAGGNEGTPVAGGALARNALLVSGTGTAAAASGQTVAYRKDGTYTGRREYAYYGYIKVQAVINNGTLADIRILEYPNDNGRSHYINSVALPYLMQEAVDAQSFRVDFISGATFTSSAFVKSLQAALQQAGT
jgi:uncharacterized protein with FMN-binding domain